MGNFSAGNASTPDAEPVGSGKRNSSQRAVHLPVMLREVIQQLQLEPGLVVADGTLGAGGHSREILKAIGSAGMLLAFDRDPMMISLAEKTVCGENVHIHQGSYIDIREVLARHTQTTGRPPLVDRLLLDLGYSSDQLADRQRGFSFQTEGPLDLRFSTSENVSAAQWLATAHDSEIVRVLTEFGEEPFAERLGPAIGFAARRGELQTTKDLVRVVEQTVPPAILRNAEKHPATRVFQALRIQVNDELTHVSNMLNQIAPEVLAPRGIMAVITFHSLEDRLVKQAFRQKDVWQELSDKPIVPTPAEIRFNPRSRSAKLRIAQRVAGN